MTEPLVIRLEDIAEQLTTMPSGWWERNARRLDSPLPEVAALMRSVSRGEWQEAADICKEKWVVMKPQTPDALRPYCSWTWMESWFRAHIDGSVDIGANPTYRKGEAKRIA